MGTLKSQEINRFINRPDPATKVILLFGPDSGLVAERADKIAQNCGVDLSDSFAHFRINADDAASDPGRLIDEAQTINMFGGDRLIRVSGTTRGNLAVSLKPLIENQIDQTWVIIESGDLKKNAAIRTLFERAKSAVAIPCYMDEASSLDELITEEIIASGLTIDHETRNYLKQFLGSDRLASRNELRKLAVYAQDEQTITPRHIEAIISDASNIDLTSVLDEIASGQIESLEENLERLMEQGVSPDMLLLNALRHFQQIHEIRGKSDAGGMTPSTVINGLRPPVFWKRKDRLTRIVAKLNLPQIDRIIARLNQATFEARSKPELGHAIAGTCLLAVLLEVRRRQ